MKRTKVFKPDLQKAQAELRNRYKDQTNYLYDLLDDSSVRPERKTQIGQELRRMAKEFEENLRMQSAWYKTLTMSDDEYARTTGAYNIVKDQINNKP